MIETKYRKSLFSEIQNYCHLSNHYDYIEATEWSNGEGWDIVIDRKNGSERFTVSYGEWNLLMVLMNYKDES